MQPLDMVKTRHQLNVGHNESVYKSLVNLYRRGLGDYRGMTPGDWDGTKDKCLMHLMKYVELQVYMVIHQSLLQCLGRWHPFRGIHSDSSASCKSENASKGASG